MSELFSNNASTTLGSSLSSGSTTVTVATGTGAEFPSPSAGQYFTATLWEAGNTSGLPNEIVKVTSRSGDTMTVLRGQEGTVAQNWNVGDTFANYPTAAFYNNAATASDVQQQAGNYAVDSGTAAAGVITLSPAVGSLSALLGMPIRVQKMNAANTGAYTLNINGLGAEAVTLNGSNLIAGQLAASQIFEVIWDGSSLELQTPAPRVKTQSLGDNSTLPASTAYVDASIVGLLKSSDFGQDAANPGFKAFPALAGDQFVIQFGSGNTVTGNADPVTFATPFLNACIAVVIVEAQAGGWGGSPPSPTIYGTSNVTTTGFDVSGVKWAGSTWAYEGSITYSYIAIGY